MIKLKEIKTRFLYSREKEILNTENESPFVFEPTNENDSVKLPGFLAENSDEVLEKIRKHGAVLLRGFKIFSETEFEQAITAIKEFKPMDNYFMSEDGRTLIDGCNYVYHTNKNYKTGGTLRLGGFHTENYYTCDVPHFISFCCLKPSLFGGETGLVHVGKVYHDLKPDIKDKLKANTFFTVAHTVSSLSKRYNISEKQIKAACNKFGLKVITSDDGEEYTAIYKPSVVYHPINNTPSLAVNLSSEIPGLDEALLNEFKSSYSGLKWTFHRIAWRYSPKLVMVSQVTVKQFFVIATQLLKKKISKNSQVKNNTKTKPQIRNNRFGSVFTADDTKLLAKSMRSHFTAFKWQKGDVLLIDNLQMAHAGMPGFGSRTIRAVLSNPLSMNYSQSGPGDQRVGNVSTYKSLAKTIENIQNPKEFDHTPSPPQKAPRTARVHEHELVS